MNGQVQPPAMGQPQVQPQYAPQQNQQPVQQQPSPMAQSVPQAQVPQQPAQGQYQQPQLQQSNKIDPKVGQGLKIEWGYVNKQGINMYYGTPEKDQMGQPLLNPDGTRVMKSYVPQLKVVAKHMQPNERHSFKVLADGIKAYTSGMYPSYKLFCKCTDANESQSIGLPDSNQAINLDLSNQANGKISSLNPMKGDTLIITHGTFVTNTGAIQPVVNAEIIKPQGQGYPPQQPPAQGQMMQQQQSPMAPQQGQYQPPVPNQGQPQQGYQAPPQQQQNMNTGNPNIQQQQISGGVNAPSMRVDTPSNPVPNVGVNPPSSFSNPLNPQNPPTQEELEFLRDYETKVPIHHSPEHFMGCRLLRDSPNEPEVVRLKHLYKEHFCKTQIEKEGI